MSLNVHFWGWRSSYLRPFAWGWQEVTTATPVEVLQPQPKYVLHGFNRYRTLQWGGRFRPK